MAQTGQQIDFLFKDLQLLGHLHRLRSCEANLLHSAQADNIGEVQIARLIYGPHTPGAEGAQDLVPFSERVAWLKVGVVSQ